MALTRIEISKDGYRRRRVDWRGVGGCVVCAVVGASLGAIVIGVGLAMGWW